MKLDFNFQIKSWVDSDESPAKDALLLVFQTANVKDEIFLDKIENWKNEIIKSGYLEVDAPDANFIKKLVLASDMNALGKIAIKKKIEKL